MAKTNVTERLHPLIKSASRKSRPSVRACLLEEAMRLFSARGFDGVAVDEIVAAAGVNKRMVYHYFGSKEGLYGAVLISVFEQLEDLETSLSGLSNGELDPAAALRAIVVAYFQFLRTHPEFVRLLLWENLQEGRHLALIGTAVTKTTILHHLETILSIGIKKKLFRANLDAHNVLVSLIGLCLVYFSNRHTLSWTVGLKLSDPKVMEQAEQHATSMLLGGVQAGGK